MELLGRTIALMQSNEFGDVVGDDSDFRSCVNLKPHIVSIHIDMTGPGMALVRVDRVQSCHVVQMLSRCWFTNYCNCLGETLGAEMAFFLAPVVLDLISRTLLPWVESFSHRVHLDLACDL